MQRLCQPLPVPQLIGPCEMTALPYPLLKVPRYWNSLYRVAADLELRPHELLTIVDFSVQVIIAIGDAPAVIFLVLRRIKKSQYAEHKDHQEDRKNCFRESD